MRANPAKRSEGAVCPRFGKDLAPRPTDSAGGRSPPTAWRCSTPQVVFLSLLYWLLAASPPGWAAADKLSAFRQDKLEAMDAAINHAIEENRCPGGVLWFEHKGQNYHKAYGERALIPKKEAMTEDTIFDAASLTKVIACTPAMMLLIERGKVKLDETVQHYIPEFTGDEKDTITVRQLMTHTSGLRGDIETKTDWHGQKEAVRKACEEKLQSKPGTAFRYSDINFFLLGEIVQRVSGKPLEKFVQREVYRPLRMKDTGYLPAKSKFKRVAPTEVVNGIPWRGV